MSRLGPSVLTRFSPAGTMSRRGAGMGFCVRFATLRAPPSSPCVSTPSVSPSYNKLSSLYVELAALKSVRELSPKPAPGPERVEVTSEVGLNTARRKMFLIHKKWFYFSVSHRGRQTQANDANPLLGACSLCTAVCEQKAQCKYLYSPPFVQARLTSRVEHN